MRKTLCFLLLTAALLMLPAAGCSRVPEGNAEDGERWYNLYRCSGCHGENGRGARGPALAGTEISFSRFLHFLRSPDSQIMPAYGAVRLPDQDAVDIYLWLRQQNSKK